MHVSGAFMSPASASGPCSYLAEIDFGSARLREGEKGQTHPSVVICMYPYPRIPYPVSRMYSIDMELVQHVKKHA